jgi:hypothetical protein
MMWGALNSKTSIYYCVIRVVVNCRLDFYSLLFHCCFSSNVSLRFVFCILFHWYHAIIITNFKDKSHKKSVHNSSRKKKHDRRRGNLNETMTHGTKIPRLLHLLSELSSLPKKNDDFVSLLREKSIIMCCPSALHTMAGRAIKFGNRRRKREGAQQW